MKTILGWTCLALVPGAVIGAVMFQNQLKNRPRGQVKGSKVSFTLMVSLSVLAVVLFLLFLALVVHTHHPPIVIEKS